MVLEQETLNELIKIRKILAIGSDSERLKEIDIESYNIQKIAIDKV